MKNTIKDSFKPFYLEFDRLALYDYPGEMIKEISIRNYENRWKNRKYKNILYLNGITL